MAIEKSLRFAVYNFFDEVAQRSEVLLPPSRTLEELRQEIERQLDSNVFDLFYKIELSAEEEICIGDYEQNLDLGSFLQQRLDKLGHASNTPLTERTHILVVHKKHDGPSGNKSELNAKNVPKTTTGAMYLHVDSELMDDANSCGSSASKDATVAPLKLSNVPQRQPTEQELFPDIMNLYEITPMPHKGSEPTFVGLVNQAMTCYLNSLLQTLFMTPEFRHALYNWEYTGGVEEQRKSIPFQLQKLFVLLQKKVGIESALETKDLTRSFGWDSSHAWDQHDVQELCRVMFDALELKWRRTSQSNIINDLYQGTIKDYVKCLECTTENAKNDVFLDLPLAIKPFGSNRAYESIEEALRAFAAPEVLTGTNQYFCEKCRKKCDAYKGLKIVKFPYLLTIQLKRFDFDYNTLHRIKLNNRMTFPDLLNLNTFVEDAGVKTAPNVETAMDVTANEEVISVASGNNVTNQASVNGDTDAMEASDDEGIDVGSCNGGSGADCVEITKEKQEHVLFNDESSNDAYDASLVNAAIDNELLQKYLKDGPFVYELFSVMVHSGSANGGHYYAYIKNMDTKVWYCFNDQSVSQASVNDVRKTFGGASSNTSYMYSYSSSANAYMLMYRQIDADRNLKLPSNAQLPEHLERMIDEVTAEEEEQRLLKERQGLLSTCHVYCYDPSDGMLSGKVLHLPKSLTIDDVTQAAYATFPLSSLGISREQCRLVKFSSKHELLLESLRSSDTLADLGYMVPDLLLEVSRRPEWFRPYLLDGVTLKLHTVDVGNGHVSRNKLLVYASQDATIQEVKSRIAELLECNPADVVLVLDRFDRSLRVLDVAEQTLAEVDTLKCATIFVQTAKCDLEPFSTVEEFEKTRLYQLLDQFKNTVALKVKLPTDREYDMVGLTPPDKSHLQSLTSSSDEGRIRNVDEMTSKCSLLGPTANPVHTCAEAPNATCDRTQYVTPITSRSPSPRYDPSSLTRPDWSSNNSGAVNQIFMLTETDATTPSPQVSPDLSPGMKTLMDTSAGGTPSPQVSPDVSPSIQALSDDMLAIGGKSNISNEPCLKLWHDMNNYAGLDEQHACPRVFSLPISDFHMVDSTTAEVDPADQITTEESPATRDYSFNVTNVEHTIGPSSSPVLYVDADKRMPIPDFVKKLAPFVGVGADQFKLYKTYLNDEYECGRSPSTTLDSCTSSELKVKLGRPLKRGESLVKFYRYELTDTSVNNHDHLFDMPLMTSSKIEDIRHECAILLKRCCGLDITVSKIRLRDAVDNCMDILHDGTTLQCRTGRWSSEIFLQTLEEPETATRSNHRAVILRRWCPSVLSIGPIQEVVIETGCTFPELFDQISRLTGVPVNRLEMAINEGWFPSSCGTLKLLESVTFQGLNDRMKKLGAGKGVGFNGKGDAEDRQNTNTPSLIEENEFRPEQKPFIPHDGIVIYFRDSQEQQKVLTCEERKELLIRDNASLHAIIATGYVLDGGRIRDNHNFSRAQVRNMQVPADVVEKIGAILSDSKAPLKKRFRALFTLRHIGGERAIELIAKNFDDSSALLKHELAYCLGQMADRKALSHLITVLQDEKQEAMVRHEAGEAIGAIGADSELQLLEKYSKDPRPEVAETCQLAVARIRWLMENNFKAVKNIYSSTDPAPPSSDVNVEALKKTLLDANLSLWERYRAMFSLRDLASDDAILAICEGLSCEDSALFRHEIAFVLGQLQSPLSVDALTKRLRLNTENSMVRHECAEALGSVATKQCEKILEEYLTDEERVVRESCEVALDMCDYENSDEFQYANGLMVSS